MKENIIINTQTLINYAHGMLKPQLANYVKSKIENDALLQQEYNGIIRLMTDYPDEDIEDVVERLTSSSEIKKNKPNFSIHTKWYAIAASVLLLLSLGWWLSTNDNHSQNQIACLSVTEILEKEHKYVPQVRDLPKNTPAWLKAFNDDKFQESVQLLSSSPQTLKPVEQYYLALSYLYSSPPNYDEAAKHLNVYLESGAVALKSKCHLYLGAIAIKQNKSIEARMHLSQVSTEDKNQADFLLREIK